MPGVAHDRAIRDPTASGGGGKAASQAVPGEPTGVEAGPLAGALDDKSHRLVREPVGLDLVVPIDRPEDRPSVIPAAPSQAANVRTGQVAGLEP
jgi:hypothetical protein